MDVHQRKNINAELQRLEKLTETLGSKVLRVRDNAFIRFPFLFLFLTTFGLVATFYGFEKIIESIPYFVEHPYMILVSGIVTLVATGTLFRKLS